MKFKSQYTFQTRYDESLRIMNKYPDKLPVICEKTCTNTDIPQIDKIKYLVPSNLTMGQFLYVIKTRMKLSPEKAIFLFVNKTIPSNSSLISEIYSKYKEADNFLYLTYSGESVFGNIHSKIKYIST